MTYIDTESAQEAIEMLKSKIGVCTLKLLEGNEQVGTIQCIVGKELEDKRIALDGYYYQVLNCEPSKGEAICTISYIKF